MLILLLLPLIPVCILISRTRTDEQIRATHQKNMKAAGTAAATVAAATVMAIKDGDGQ